MVGGERRSAPSLAGGSGSAGTERGLIEMRIEKMVISGRRKLRAEN